MIADKDELTGVPEKASKVTQNNGWMVVLYFRWLMLTIIGVFCFADLEASDARNVVIETLAVAIVYNVLVTLHTISRQKGGRKASLLILYSDIIILSAFSCQFGGLSSDIYVVFFFLIGYCAMSSNAVYTIKVSLFCVLAYSISSIYSAKINNEGLSYLRLVLKDCLIILAAYGITCVNHEVKKYNEMHKKEFKMARIDKLTGLANRHYMEQKLKEEVEYSNFTGSPINILIFDLDNFKKFNDSYGHVWGDKLLTLFSDIIKQNIRKSDIPVRYGGEEFLILIRDLDIYIAKSVGERIRRQLEKQKILLGDEEGKKRVTVSCGIAQYPTHSRNAKDAIELADKALYHAKENGKNMVVTYDEITE